MANKPQVKIVNVETGEEIEREMTDAEYIYYQANQAESAAQLEEQRAKEDARSAILERLGLTHEDLKLLLG